jgi:2',3'-cyclic-nucleotide 2'-phosphodiesterase
MRLLICGDIVGRAAREAVAQQVPRLRRELKLDFVIANGENAAHGFGITETICAELYAAGVDVITTGNHVWDRREIMAYIDSDARLLRPINFPPGTPGNGFGIYGTTPTSNQGGPRILVVNAMARLFMDAIDDPFAAIDRLLTAHPLGSVDAIIVDFHGEATSEKTSMGHFCDGRATAVVGTHSHVPSADHRLLANGTAYVTDLGMCGDYDSVIGMQKDVAVARFVKKLPGERLEVAMGEPTICGAVIETDPVSGLARGIWPLRIGGKLDPAMPPQP